MSAWISIVIETASDSVAQLNQRQADASNGKNELNNLIDYLGSIAGGNQIVPGFYVVTTSADPAVTTDGGASTKTDYVP